MTRGEHRRSGGHEHRHRGSHRHASEAHFHAFSESSSHAEGGIGGRGLGGGFGGEGGHGGHSSVGGHDHGSSSAMDATFVWKLSKLGRIGSSRLRFDDDFADRLNYQYTGVLMFLFIGLIGIRQYVGKPIQCWIPQEFTRGWEEYAENYCWVSNTYFAPIHNRLPPAPDREMLLIGYYQWAPIVMAIQAMAFYLPCLIWRLFMAQSGFNVRRILQMACDSNVLLPEHMMKNVRFIARYMEGCIYRQRDYRRRKATHTTGYSPTNYTALGTMHHLHPTHPLHHHHHHHHHHPHTGFPHTPGTTPQQPHHHHHLHPQSPPYASTPAHAPPLYTSTTGGTVTFTSANAAGATGGFQPSPPGRRGPGNGDTGNFGSGAPASPPPPPLRGTGRNRRSNSGSLLNRLRMRLSVTSELEKQKKQEKQSKSPNTRGSRRGLSDEEGNGGSDEHPMLGRRKMEEENEASTGYHGGRREDSICSESGPNGLGNGVIGESQNEGMGCCGRRYGNYLVVLYFFIKILYLTNIVGQMILMEKFVGNNYTFYGLRVLIDLIKGREWFHSGNFPRVTFCDFEAKKLGKNHKYTLQCVLPLNMFLEKIYIFLWFWHCMVGLVTLSSFIVWFYRMGFANRRVKFVRKYLKIMSVLRDTDKAASGKFVENYLRPDGVFLIRLISINVGDLMAGDLACELWHIYRHKRLHEIEDKKHIDATVGISEFGFNADAPPASNVAIGNADLNISSSGRRLEKIHPTSVPLLPGGNNINGSSNNNDDSIV